MSIFGNLFSARIRAPINQEFIKVQEATGLSVLYHEGEEGASSVTVRGASTPLVMAFTSARIDEAHILYMQSSEILADRAKAGEDKPSIEAVLRELFAKYSS